MHVKDKLKRMRAKWFQKVISYKAKRIVKKLHREQCKVAK